MPQFLTENQPLPPSRRLVVIIPDTDINALALSRQIWEMASPDARRVLLLTKPSYEEDEFQARINLASLAAYIGDTSVVVQTQLVIGQSLVQAIRQCAQPGDIFICFDGHRIGNMLKKRPLAEALAQSTLQPVYVLKGSFPRIPGPLAARLLGAINLAFCLISLIAFFAVEVWIQQNSTGTIQSIFLILAVFAEVWLIAMLSRKSPQI